MERLQKIIANSGYCSRRKAEVLIESGKVFVNGEKITNLGAKASYSDQITINGCNLKLENKEYILLYKPRGVVTTTNDEKGRKTVMDLISTTNRLYPVGRLDYDTSGLLILTNDGELTNLLIHPRNNIEKVYVAKIEGLVKPEFIKKMCAGVMIDGKKTAKAKAKIKKIDKKNNFSLVELTIHEGKNHQVKKMFEAIGYKVTKLKREKFAGLTLSGLTSGKYRHLTIKEVKTLYSLGKK
ncbi:MAG: rRNA pseudouridine synthase [Bacilli bacterium]|nr:rRNA pseudouridine synthase [Bacilli bacterium]